MQFLVIISNEAKEQARAIQVTSRPYHKDFWIRYPVKIIVTVSRFFSLP